MEITFRGQEIHGRFADTAVEESARFITTLWGMSDKLGPVSFRRGEEHVFLGREMAQQRDYSEHTAQLIDEEVQTLLRSIESKVKNLLQDNRHKLDTLAGGLLEKETLVGGEIRQLLETE